MRAIHLLLLLTAGPAIAEGPLPLLRAENGIECYCTDRNHNRVDLGQVICMQVDGRLFTARCEMSLNTPMWREITEGCATSGLGQPAALSPPFG